MLLYIHIYLRGFFHFIYYLCIYYILFLSAS